MEQLTNKKLIERKDKQVPVDWLANEIFNQRLNMFLTRLLTNPNGLVNSLKTIVC